MAHRRVGLWLIGSNGSVASSVALGLSAVARGLVSTTGMVTALPWFDRLDLDTAASFVVGGHDIRSTDFASSASRVGGGSPAYPARLIDECRPDLDRWSGCARPSPEPGRPTTFVSAVTDDIRRFQEANQLDQVAVINVASTEPPAEPHPAQSTAAGLDASFHAADWSAMPLSGWYAFAALRAKLPYVNFTPSCGASLPGLIEFSRIHAAPVAGSDGKTGETLLKTVLAPMFAARNLKVLSWVGHNILGNNDGRTLADPRRRVSKLFTKDQVVASTLGYDPQTLTSIEFVESLDDWKTAWDHIHFEGFLGVRMSLQFTWQGCDSALAAPLVIDLARLTLLAQRRGEAGPLGHLAVFFKNPLSGGGHDFAEQWRRLLEYAAT
jgi:myo-inositol-1-phosphate synthase